MIAVDWGTSSLRAYRLDAAGDVLDQRSSATGLLACGGRFEAILAEHVDGWADGAILMAGMIGSRSGWCEVPYTVCPAGLVEIAAGMREISAASLSGRRIWIVPGVVHRSPQLPPEVMRGEETQLLGLAEHLVGTGPHWVCLPGTHSKWVKLEDGRIQSLRTAMTGELYALLRRHSLLATMMPEPTGADVDDEAAFARGVAASAGPGGLLHQLFGVRTLGIFAQLDGAQAPSYLSGLLIGHELRELLPGDAAVVNLVGAGHLTLRYARALGQLGVASRSHGEALTARGLYRLGLAQGFAP